MNFFSEKNILFFLATLSMFFFSCGGNKEATEKTTTKSRALFIQDANFNKDETYSSIKGSVKRLHAIMCGRFVQYSTGIDPEEEKYSTWLINEGQDSVIIYHLPIGDPDKEGYWMYNCQVMTSLPNDPLHVTISKLEEVNRDTIKAVYYDLPADFNMSLPDILENPKKAFTSINLLSLKKSEGESIPYVRENTIHYKGESVWFPGDRESNEGGFLATYFLVRPGMMVFGSVAYNKDEKYLGQTKGECLMKNARINPDYLK